MLIDGIYCFFPFILTHDLLRLFSLGSAGADVRWGGNLNSYLVASGVRNISAKNYLNLITFFQVMIDNVGDVFFLFLCISMHISLGLHSLGSAETNIGRGGKLNGHLMASCVRNIHIRNY